MGLSQSPLIQLRTNRQITPSAVVMALAAVLGCASGHGGGAPSPVGLRLSGCYSIALDSADDIPRLPGHLPSAVNLTSRQHPALGLQLSDGFVIKSLDSLAPAPEIARWLPLESSDSVSFTWGTVFASWTGSLASNPEGFAGRIAYSDDAGGAASATLVATRMSCN